jgi:hypothetical protein
MAIDWDRVARRAAGEAADAETGPKLTEEQVSEARAEMVGDGVPVRFMLGGRALNIETGGFSPEGAGIMHQTVYWGFPREVAREIAGWLGAEAVFSG